MKYFMAIECIVRLTSKIFHLSVSHRKCRANNGSDFGDICLGLRKVYRRQDG